MPPPRFVTITGQVATCLREQIKQGRWTPWMPGRHELARDLEVRWAENIAHGKDDRCQVLWWMDA